MRANFIADVRVPWTRYQGAGVTAFQEAITAVEIAAKANASRIGSGSLATKVHLDRHGASSATLRGEPPSGFVELGTRAHEIVPSSRLALHWTNGGEHFATRVSHPGTKAQPFLRPAAYLLYELFRAAFGRLVGRGA